MEKITTWEPFWGEEKRAARTDARGWHYSVPDIPGLLIRQTSDPYPVDDDSYGAYAVGNDGRNYVLGFPILPEYKGEANYDAYWEKVSENREEEVFDDDDGVTVLPVE